MAHNAGTTTSLFQGIESPGQKSTGNFWLCIDKQRNHIHFCIPEIMPLVALSSQRLSRHAAPAISACPLENVEKIKVYSLDNGISISSLYIYGSSIPKIIHIRLLVCHQGLHSKVDRFFQLILNAFLQRKSFSIQAGTIRHEFINKNRFSFN